MHDNVSSITSIIGVLSEYCMTSCSRPRKKIQNYVISTNTCSDSQSLLNQLSRLWVRKRNADVDEKSFDLLGRLLVVSTVSMKPDCFWNHTITNV